VLSNRPPLVAWRPLVATNPDLGVCLRDQTYVPTKQPTSQQDPWVPAADAHARWPRHSVRPPPQGPLQARCLTRAPPVLPAAARLRHSEDFRRAVRQGRRVTAPTIVVHAVPTTPQSPAAVGFVVSKAVGKAVERNTVKRRLRHAVRDQLVALSGYDVVIRARPEAAGADYSRLKADIDRCSHQLQEASR
jgi:ribonuclease P protein component